MKLNSYTPSGLSVTLGITLDPFSFNHYCGFLLQAFIQQESYYCYRDRHNMPLVCSSNNTLLAHTVAYSCENNNTDPKTVN